MNNEIKRAPRRAEPEDTLGQEIIAENKPPSYQNYDKELVALLTQAVRSGASDVHIKSGFRVRLRVNGVLRHAKSLMWEEEKVFSIIKKTMTPDQWLRYNKTRELDYALAIPYRDEATNAVVMKRFRVNTFFSKGLPGLILRLVESTPPDLANLGLPSSIYDLAEEKFGLVLIVGATGSGKTTTLAGVINHINHKFAVNIVTLEDPIEVIHEDKQASIIQREVDIDTLSFANGLKAVLRQDPDVILLGELRDAPTVRTALEAANTGHLVFATIHASTAVDAIGRVLDLFSDNDEREKVRTSLAQSMRGVIAQKLIPKIGGGRVAALEILLNQGRVGDAISNPNKYDLEEIMKESEKNYNMQTMETHLLRLVELGSISPEDAVAYSNNAHDIKTKLRTLIKGNLEAKPI